MKKFTLLAVSLATCICSWGTQIENGHSAYANGMTRDILELVEDEVLPETSPKAESGELIEIPQDQGKDLDTFTRTEFEAGDEYNTYTANGDLQIAFKMMNIDVKGCDYVVVKFTEPVAAGWQLAFWENQDLVPVPEGATEYKFELEPQMLSSGVLPQICMMTFFGGYTAPLVAKVEGVYKHMGESEPTTPTKVEKEVSLNVNGVTRTYLLYVPEQVAENPALVFSLHGASGHSTDRSPFRTSVADEKGCIVVYPQGVNQYFPVFGGSVTGWNATGAANEDLDFFKQIIEDVAADYAIDRSRIYCCGFSNGGMMTYSNASAAADIFAAFASISGFQLNEFHHRPTGARPVPFLHIHGMSDDFVKYSCMPVIRDNMVARNGCNPVPEVSEVAGKYRCSVYEAGEGGFPYIYYEIEGMGHNDYTDKTPEGNSALTMWNFLSQYTLEDECDPTLKWRLNIDTEGFVPTEHYWTVSADKTRFTYGTAKKANNADNNVYPSLQFEAGNYMLTFESTGTEGNKMYIQLEALDGNSVLFCKSGKVGGKVVMPFSVDAYSEYKITIVKTSPDDKFTSFAIHSCAEPASAENSEDDVLPEDSPEPEGGYLIEIPQAREELEGFSTTGSEAGDECNTYTATGDLQIAFKMVDINVKDCDYVVVKFAEPVAAGWKVAFWEGQTLVDVPEGATEYKFELEPQMVSSGLLPQICMMTFFGGYTAPLIAKVEGVYKHCTLEAPTGIERVSNDSEVIPEAYFSLSGARLSSLQKGINIVRTNDGQTKKVLMK